MMICLSINLFYTIQFPQYCIPHSRGPFLLNNTSHVDNFEYRSYIDLALLQEKDFLMASRWTERYVTRLSPRTNEEKNIKSSWAAYEVRHLA
jgi:hypothetical protein